MHSLDLLTWLFALFFFFNDTATTEIYTLSLHDALPIFPVQSCRHRRNRQSRQAQHEGRRDPVGVGLNRLPREDRKSTRLNSSHGYILYDVFCLKKKIHNPRLVWDTPCVRSVSSSWTIVL